MSSWNVWRQQAHAILSSVSFWKVMVSFPISICVVPLGLASVGWGRGLTFLDFFRRFGCPVCLPISGEDRLPPPRSCSASRAASQLSARGPVLRPVPCRSPPVAVASPGKAFTFCSQDGPGCRPFTFGYILELPCWCMRVCTHAYTHYSNHFSSRTTVWDSIDCIDQFRENGLF